jgi:hypothetical protein
MINTDLFCEKRLLHGAELVKIKGIDPDENTELLGNS